MESQAIEYLRNEHDEILSMCNKLRKQFQNTEGPVLMEILAGALEFFRVYGDVYHHQKEENLLFPGLARQYPMLGDGIIAELEEHHEEFRNFLQEAEVWLNEGKEAEAVKTIEEYMDLLEDHIAAENDELFVSAQSLLSENELERIYFSFIDLDRELGFEDKEKLIQMI